mmetsp:Transcript_35290/g.92615  ORF Transcript_35290/g.92615 Transcript_35290/m.92615 type:complete len:342 (-) Transcript_35290:321-1346(-)
MQRLRVSHHRPQLRPPCDAVNAIPATGYPVGTKLEPWAKQCKRVVPTPACHALSCGNDGGHAAVCLVGSARTFVRPHVVKAFRTNLLAALQASKIDVFAVMRLDDVNPKEQAWYNHVKLDVDQADLVSALSQIGPSAAVIDTGNSSESVYGVSYNPRCSIKSGAFMGASRNHLMRSVAQPASWKKCMDLIEAAEASNPMHPGYDWIIKTRADLYWFFPHPPLCSLSPKVIYVHSWVDHHFALPRHIARAIMSTVEDYQRCDGVLSHMRVEGWLSAAINAAASDLTSPSAATARPSLQCRMPNVDRRVDGRGGRQVPGISFVHFPAAIIRANSSETEYVPSA